MTAVELNQCYLAQTWLGWRVGIQTWAKAALFYLVHVPFLLLPLSLIDKDKANLFGNQGHGCCRQTLLLHAPLRCPFPQCFVFSSQFLHKTKKQCAMPEHSSVKTHSCHTLALLQYISSSQGHDSASPVITTGILIIISTAEYICHANHNRSNNTIGKQWGPNLGKGNIFLCGGQSICWDWEKCMFVLIQCWLFLNYKHAHIKTGAEQKKTNNKCKQKTGRDSVEFDTVAPSLLYFFFSVWWPTEVTASVDTVLTIMLDNDHSTGQIPPALPARQVCRAS